MFLRINFYPIFHCLFFYLKRDNILVEIVKFVFQKSFLIWEDFFEGHNFNYKNYQFSKNKNLKEIRAQNDTCKLTYGITNLKITKITDKV